MEMQLARVGDGRQRRLLAAVLAIAEDRAPDGRAMDAQLMGPSGARPQGEQRGAPAGAVDHPEMGQRLLAVLLVDLHQLAVEGAWPLGEGEVDRPLLLRGHADHDRPVELLGLAITERGRQVLGRLAGPRDQQQPAGVLVNPVHNSRPELIPNPREVSLAMEEQGVHQGAVRVARCGMHHHPLRLVHHQHVALVKEELGDGPVGDFLQLGLLVDDLLGG